VEALSRQAAAYQAAASIWYPVTFIVVVMRPTLPVVIGLAVSV
jgi:hypothetical protein